MKIHSTSISQAKRHISNRTHVFASVPLLSVELLFFLAEVVRSRIPPGKDTHRNILVTEQLAVAAFVCQKVSKNRPITCILMQALDQQERTYFIIINWSLSNF